MSCPIDQQSVEKLKQFLAFVKLQPDILHQPQLAFFKEFVESFGGTIPEPQMKSETKTEEKAEAPAAKEVDSGSDSDLELDMEGCIEPDKLDENQKMGNAFKKVTEEDSDNADDKRREAMLEFSKGNFEKAIELFTEAIEIYPINGLFFAKRGQTFLKLNRPNACIKDCTRALELNPDSANAYKFRGRAYRLIGEFELAARDLRVACTIDLDEQIDEWLKEVTPNAKKIEEHLLKKERKKKDKAEKERLERVRQAREAHARASAQHTAPGATEIPPGAVPPMADFMKLFDDPEIKAGLQDPEVVAAFEDISANPANLLKYQSNPKIAHWMTKLTSKLSGSGASFPGAPGAGFPFGPGGGAPAEDNLD